MNNKLRKLPAYPLFIKDPYFSLWANSEDICNENPMFWCGNEVPMLGLISVNGTLYRFLGKGQGLPLEVKDVEVTALSTVYTFDNEDFTFKVKYLSPLPLDDLELLSMPLCYMEYEIIPKTKLQAKVFFSVSSRVCHNPTNTQPPVRGDVFKFENFESSWFALNKQNVLSQSADRVVADWGYWYLGGEKCYFCDADKLSDIYSGEKVYPSSALCEKYITAVNTHKDVYKGKFIMAFDDVCSIYYYGELLRGYYFRDGKNICDVLNIGWNNAQNVFEKCDKFEEKFKQRLNGYDKSYYDLCCASYRQSVGAHKLVEDKKGRKLFLSKECASDGCIATVDITYPSMPLYLLFAPELVKGMLYPIFDFARMPVWEYDYAPHDAGVYPYCFGQYYAIWWLDENPEKRLLNYLEGDREGLGYGVLPLYWQYPKGSGIYTEKRQMPVEECANMLIVTALTGFISNDFGIVEENYDLLARWAGYLDKKGLVPENQLCTDDFAGHLDKNVNLAIKSVIALKCFATLRDKLNKDGGGYYMKVAKERAEQMKQLFKGTMPQTFDSGEDTFSLKYNLIIDRLVGEELFGEEIREMETDLYVKKTVDYGCPLDQAHVWTKSDWLCWVASLTDDKQKRRKLLTPINKFLEESPDRAPFPDWYNTDTGTANMFRARTVQGGVFMPVLVDEIVK